MDILIFHLNVEISKESKIPKRKNCSYTFILAITKSFNNKNSVLKICVFDKKEALVKLISRVFVIFTENLRLGNKVAANFALFCY